MVEFVACALIVSGFWVLLELGKFALVNLRREGIGAELSVPPGGEYIERYADAFRRLSESYREMPKRREHLGEDGLEHIILQMRGQFCGSCDREAVCWEEQYYAMRRRIQDYLGEMEDAAGNPGGGISFQEAFCRRETDFFEELHRVYLNERVDLMWNNRLLEQRAAAGEQLQDTAELLTQMAQRLYQIRGLNDRDYSKLKKELQYERIQCKSAWIFSRDEAHPEFYITMRMEGGNCIPAKDLSEIFSKLLRHRMAPARDCRLAVKKEYETFHFVTDTEYQMLCGIARMTKEGELVSGDNFAFWQSDSGQLVMSLADGMGCGVQACSESEKVIELLEQFLDAGFSQDTAVRMLNTSMILQDHLRIFSTIDLCMVDLYNGNCSMIKAGACATYLIRGGNLEVIPCGTLPAGILQAADYRADSRRLISGDMVIMMTDGAADALPEENREKYLAELIGRIRTENMKEFASRLLEAILIRQKLRVRDDMTVLVGQIWDK